ncbi:uncharacterized protein LOC108904499 [Anoplophora glabripennis]|uniref:uncharacterized protein LOC108904499 n=1 Tax=Anoplophora glabripennis TaxID=217634 RepID=UPI000873D9E8|nr:uncharacterized protein LOC108904499 [Anoplophora glabripennis]
MEEEDNAFFDALGSLSDAGKIDVAIFNYVIKLKDRIIKELQEKNSLLNNQIELMNRTDMIKTLSPVTQKMDKEEKHVKVKTNHSGKNVNKPGIKQTADGQNDSSGTITKNAVSLGLMQTESEIKLNKYIDINNDLQKPSTSKLNEWQKVGKKKANKKQMIVGSNKNNKLIQGVPKETVLHVYRLNKVTTVDSLKEHVKQHFPEVTVESLASKHPHLYASFKVTVLEEHFSKAMDPELWPHGACVSRFLFLRTKESPQG